MKHTLETGSNSRGTSPTLAMVLSQLCWGGSPSYPSYEGRNEAAADGGAAAAAGSSAAAAGGTGAPAAPASPAGDGTAASSTANAGGGGAPAGGSNEDNLRVLRQNYETLKPWEQVAKTIKDPAQAVQAHQRVQKMHSDGLALAKALGYTAESFEAAFNDDPVDVLAHLRAEHARANPDAAAAERIRKAAEEAARKATEPVTQQLNKQQTENAMRTLDTEFERLARDEKIGFGPDVPKEVKDAVYDIMDMLLPDTVLAEIKTQGKVSGVQAAFEQAKGVLLTVVNSYNAMVNGRAQNGGGAGAGNTNPAGGSRNLRTGGNAAAAAEKPLTLDQIIDDPSLLPGIKAGKY